MKQIGIISKKHSSKNLKKNVLKRLSVLIKSIPTLLNKVVTEHSNNNNNNRQKKKKLRKKGIIKYIFKIYRIYIIITINYYQISRTSSLSSSASGKTDNFD